MTFARAVPTSERAANAARTMQPDTTPSSGVSPSAPPSSSPSAPASPPSPAAPRSAAPPPPDPRSAAAHGTAIPTVALALGGGGARGLAHIHALEALDDLGIRPVAIAGSSIGAIMGAALAAGITGREMREHALATFADRAELAARLWRLRPATLGGLARDGLLRDAMRGALRPGQIRLDRVMAAFLPELPATFDELSIPLTVVTTDFYGHCERHITSGDLHSALAASATIPGIFRPVIREGRVLVDGNVYNPCPFDLVHGRADLTIAIDVVGAPDGDPSLEPKTLDCLIGSNQLMMRSVIAGKLAANPPDVLIRPEAGVRALDFHRAREVLDATAGVRDEVIAALASHGVRAAA